jgi:hypothetical protein
MNLLSYLILEWLERSSKMSNKIMPITVRLTWKEKQELIKSATESNLTMSDYIRKHLQLKGNK